MTDAKKHSTPDGLPDRPDDGAKRPNELLLLLLQLESEYMVLIY